MKTDMASRYAGSRYARPGRTDPGRNDFRERHVGCVTFELNDLECPTQFHHMFKRPAGGAR